MSEWDNHDIKTTIKAFSKGSQFETDTFRTVNLSLSFFSPVGAFEPRAVEDKFRFLQDGPALCVFICSLPVQSLSLYG